MVWTDTNAWMKDASLQDKSRPQFRGPIVRWKGEEN